MLALGGQMMISGYPSVADGVWDTPPIAPQPHQSSHIAGCLGAMDVLAALAYREETGRGQRIDLSYHAAANNCTENNLSWYMVAGAINERGPLSPEMFGGDGKYMQVMLGLFPGEWERVVAMLDEFGMAEDLKDPRYADPTFRKQPEARRHVDEVVQAFLATQTVEDAFHAAQRHGVIWAPIREAHESLDDPHFKPCVGASRRSSTPNWAARSTTRGRRGSPKGYRGGTARGPRSSASTTARSWATSSA